MTDNRKVFFHMYDEENEIDYRLPLLCSYKEISEWAQDDIEDIGESWVFALELKAVHDLDDREDEDTILFGFRSGEIDDPETRNFILTSWKEKLVEFGWADPKAAYFETTELI